MSIEPEDSLLEEALRCDLPSSHTEARLRRRLVAAGVAVGNGVAATTAAAGTSGAAASGMVAKVASLSWGIKLGFAAVVAIPTLGLVLDGQSGQRQSAAQPQQHAAMAAKAKPEAVVAAPIAAGPGVEAAPVAREPERLAPKNARPSLAEAAAPASDGAPSFAHPSQGDFAAPEAPPRSPQVGSTLADETRLLDAAFAALAAGDRSHAAELIAQHESRYPSGLLLKERQRAKLRLSELSRGE